MAVTPRARTTPIGADTFVTTWDPDTEPHIEIVGMHGTGKTTAAEAIAAHMTSIGASITHVACDDRLEDQLLTVASDVSSRYSTLADCADEHRDLLPARLILLDGYDETTRCRRPSRVHHLASALLATAGRVRVHLVICSTRPNFSLEEANENISHIALGPINPTTLRTYNPWRDTRSPARPLGSGWFFRSTQPPVPVRF